MKDITKIWTHARLTGERGLLLAIVVRSLLDLKAKDQKTRREAQSFFLFPGPSESVFEFANICDIVKLDRKSILVQLREEGLL